MKLWTMVLSLVLVGLVAGGAFAQDQGKKGRGRNLPTWKELVGDKTQLDKATFVAALTAKVTDESKKDAVKTFAERRWSSLAVAGGADKEKVDDFVFKSEDDFKAAVAKAQAARKKKQQ